MHVEIADQSSPEFEYPTAQNFNSVAWLNKTHDVFFARHRRDGAKSRAIDTVANFDILYSLQVGYNPIIPLARVVDISASQSNVWYLTPAGWVREQIPIAHEKVDQQMREYYSSSTLRDKPTCELIVPETENVLKERGYAGLGNEVTEEEMNRFINLLCVHSWEDADSEGIVYHDDEYTREDARRDYIASLELDQDYEEETAFMQDCEDIFRVLEQKPDSLFISVDPPMSITKRADAGYIVGIPQYGESVVVSNPDAVDYYSMRGGVMHKRKVVNAGDTNFMENETTGQVATLFDEPDEKPGIEQVNQAEQQYVLDYLAQNSRLVQEVSRILKWSREGSQSASKNIQKANGQGRYRTTIKTGTGGGHVMTSHLVEELDSNGKSVSSPDKVGSYTFLTTYFTTSYDIERPTSALAMTYDADTQRMRIMSQEYDVDAYMLVAETKKLVRYTNTESAGKIARDPFPKDSLIKTDTENLFLATRQLRSMRIASQSVITS